MTDAPNDTAMQPEGLDVIEFWAGKMPLGPYKLRTRDSGMGPVYDLLDSEEQHITCFQTMHDGLVFEFLDPASLTALVAAARRIPTLEAEKAEVERERDEARAAIERDRSKCAGAVLGLEAALRSREWMLEGRGPYAWDDDDYRREFGAAWEEVRAAFKPFSELARDWTNCPTDPEAIKKARAALATPGEAE